VRFDICYLAHFHTHKKTHIGSEMRNGILLSKFTRTCDTVCELKNPPRGGTTCEQIAAGYRRDLA
jgi:hypothetical protein